jgi:hypothetical protein
MPVALAFTILLGHLNSNAQTAVPRWEDLYRPPSPGAVASRAVASRELADGTILVVTERFVCVRFDHDGNPLSATQLPVAASGRRAVPAGNSSNADSPSGTSPPGYGQVHAAIDGFGRVFVSFVRDPSFDPIALSGDIETNKFDGLTGQPLWPAPQVYGGFGPQYPTAVLLDPSGDVVVAGRNRQSDHVTIKYDGQNGAILWGPSVISGYNGVACLGSGGEVFVSLGRYASPTYEIVTLAYSGSGVIFWGPVAGYSSSEGALPTACAVTPQHNVVVAGASGPNRFVVFEHSEGSGSLVWGPVTFDLPPDTTVARPTSLAADASSNVVLTGVGHTPAGGAFYETRKLDFATGAPLWGPITTVNGVANSFPASSVFGNGDVLLKALINTGAGDHLVFWRYRGADGALVWGPSDAGEAPPGFPFVTYLVSSILSDGRIFGSAVLDPTGPSAFALDGATGATLWGPTPFTVPTIGSAYFDDLTTGPDGNPVVIGDSAGALITLKYDRANGNLLWGPVTLDPGGYTSGWQVQVDGGGDAIVMASTSAPPGGILLVKYDGTTGAVLWGPVILPVMTPQRLALDSSGDAVVLGLGLAPDNNYASALTKVSGASGGVLWGPVLYHSGEFHADFPRALAVDPTGDAYVVGDSQPTVLGTSWFVLKYSGGSGSLLWSSIDLIAGQPAAVAVSASRAFVIGAGPGGMTTVAHNGADGSVAWGPNAIIGSQPYVDSGHAVAIDGAGNVIVAGTIYNVSTWADVATIKYAGSDGATLWGPSVFDGSGLGDSAYGLGLGLDALGNAVVGGYSYRSPLNSDILLLKYDGSTGSMLWGPAYEGGPGQEYLYGFSVRDTEVSVGGPSSGAMLTALFDEAFGIATPGNALPVGFCGSPYTFSLVAQNGVTPYAWSIVSGSLPPGMTLSATGILSGVPTEQGTFEFRLQVQDSAAGNVEREFTLSVMEAPSPFHLIRVADGLPCVATLYVTGLPTSIVWLPGGETTPSITVSPTETTTYGAIVSGGDGCEYRLSLTIEATELQDPECLAPRVLSIDPMSGPAAGGTALIVTGDKFQAGASLYVGGIPATNLVVVDATEMTADSPALAAGALYNVVVVNPDTANAALYDVWFADFLDVPASDSFHDYIVTLFRNGITAGCGGGDYCPALAVTRAQMAVFLLRSLYGATYVPPPAVGVFLDVPASDPLAPWIEKLYDLGITAGCGGGNYCPTSPVTRGQMAVFLLRTRNGPTYVPPPATGIFGDVPLMDPFAAWIEDLYNYGITGGCNSSPLLYCPGSSVTRGQMAVFLVRTFDLQ